mmetsp:Transcript_12455/g.21105  ORF Transcript_12455/g.21105 Transcript_12455/m.21105 type:complete len:221 (+) Transcript_12455:182-844(+)
MGTAGPELGSLSCTRQHAWVAELTKAKLQVSDLYRFKQIISGVSPPPHFQALAANTANAKICWTSERTTMLPVLGDPLVVILQSFLTTSKLNQMEKLFLSGSPLNWYHVVVNAQLKNFGNPSAVLVKVMFIYRFWFCWLTTPLQYIGTPFDPCDASDPVWSLLLSIAPMALNTSSWFCIRLNTLCRSSCCLEKPDTDANSLLQAKILPSSAATLNAAVHW